MYIQSLHIKNLRCFADVALDFHYPGRENATTLLPNINLLLGNNGAGKTTALKAIALAILAPAIEGSGFVSYHLVRRTQKGFVEEATMRANLILHKQDIGAKKSEDSQNDTVEARIKRIFDSENVSAPPRQSYWENLHDDRSSGFFIVGYGANRQVESPSTYDEGTRRRSRRLRYQRVAGLFEEAVTLAPLSAWLPRLEKQNIRHYTEIKKLINELLPTECRFDAKQEQDEYLFDFQDVSIPYNALSDGYRAYIGWLTDLLYHLATATAPSTRLVNQRGIVLLDEIDLHLHPEWQRVVVPRLSQALPNLQFFLTTHSPIIAGTVDSDSIRLAEFETENEAVLRELPEQIHGLNADEILLSSYFNLSTTRAEDAETELQRLERRAQHGDRDASLEYMRMLSKGTKNGS